MANPTWPSTIPGPIVDNAAIAPLFDNILKTQMDVGQKKRRLSTWCPDVFTLTLFLNGEQWDALDQFYRITLGEVGAFDWHDFRDQSPCTYTFQQAPTYANPAPGAVMWQATIVLMKQS